MRTQTRTQQPQAPASSDVILQVVNGSRLYGTDTLDSDLDYLGVYLASTEQILGLDKPTESRVTRTIPQGQRSDADTIESTEYELRKFLHLCLGGNPNVVPILFTPPEQVVHATPAGKALLDLAPALVSRQIAAKFAGMTRAQLGRLQGQGHVARMPNRPELIEEHGYDVKYASVAFRTAVMGRELIETGTITLPMARAEEVRAIRTGALTRQEAIAATEAELDAMNAALDSSPLPEQPDRQRVNAYAIATHLTHTA